jgi:hypothetical protein
MALAPWCIRWGVDDPRPLMRQRFRCIMCGTRGAIFSQGGCVSINDMRYSDFPVERPLRIGGGRRIGESCLDAANRNAAAYIKHWHGR